MSTSRLASFRFLALVLLSLAPALAAAQTQPTVSPTVHDFGNVGVGTVSLAEPITLYNEDGASSLQVQSGALSGPNANQFHLEPAISAHGVPVGQNEIITLVTYQPTAVGTHAATLTITTNMGSVLVALSGAGVQAKVEVSPRDLTFGATAIPGASSPQTVTIRNGGSSGLTLVSVALQGADAGSFEITSPPTLGLIDPTDTRTFDVRCHPATAGDLAAEALVTTDDPQFPAIVVRLHCVGQIAGVGVTPVSLNFGNVTVNQTATATVVFQNQAGGAAFDLDGPTWIPSSVAVFNRTLPSTWPAVVAANSGSVTVTFSFTPDAEQPYAAVALMTLDYTASGGGLVDFQIPMSGRGVQPHAAATPTTLNFGEQRTGTQGQRAVVLRNTGGATLTVSEITGLAAPFGLLSPPSLPLTLTPNAEVTLNVAFTPTVTGITGGVLTITTDDPNNNSIDVALNGTGIAPALVITPALQLEFGNQRRMTESAEQTLTLVNTGSDALAVTGITLAGAGKDAFVVAGLTAPATLTNGVPQSIKVSFAPTAVDDYAATLTIDSDDPEMPHAVINLTGAGVAPALLVQPGEDYAFPDTLVGKTTLPEVFTISNGDVAPLPLSEVRFKSATTDFVLDTGDVAGTLGVGQSVTFTVAFSPTATGSRQATLEVVLADDATPALTILVHGVGAGSSSGGGCSVAAAGAAAPGPVVLLVLLAQTRWRRRVRRP